jgi:predicted AAA+ superfamily ATPase
MKNIIRTINLQNKKLNNRATVIYGARRVGKTTLVENYLSTQRNKKILSVTSDDINVQNVLSSQDKKQLLDFIEGYDIVFIDEAQRINNIGLNIKILIDSKTKTEFILTGSTSFDLANKVGEPLVGRQNPIKLFPISILELKKNNYEIKEQLNQLLNYGMYPEIITSESSTAKKTILQELVNGYLLKDVLEMEKIKSSKIIVNLLKLLAYQIGNQVSHTELSNKLGIDQKTVSKYIDILEKCFILFSLNGYSNNLRTEIKNHNKYYFYDVGIRNALINDFNDIDIKHNIGGLWENFVIMEKIKTMNYNNEFGNIYFWRTYKQQEVDFVIEKNGKLIPYEIKWGNQKISKGSYEFEKTYKNSDSLSIINQNNFTDFIYTASPA